ncbi:MAG: homocysteine S-methyltransferase family protein [Clostridia bacterium]|nr:homocysteine S-methyltransferase family protein [Clostridia bacterium]
MSKILELIKQKRIYFDGGLGTMLQKRGLKGGELPECWNLEHPEIITDIHRQYLNAGANIITTNTFGVNCLKHENYAKLIEAAISCAKKATAEFNDSFIAFDIGPLGRFLEPIGNLPFEEAVEIFAKSIRAANDLGVDLIVIETMTDSYETKAAVLAAKENCNLPIFVTNAFDESGKLLTGATPEAMVALLEGLNVDAIGINCSLGPDKMLPIIERYRAASSLPIIANANAGLPTVVDGKAIYSLNAENFADYVSLLAESGASILGGCCGTEPDYIKSVVEKTQNIPLPQIENKNKTVISSYTHALEIGNDPILIGERINPTGKEKFKNALRNSDINYILGQGIEQADNGAHALDINVGLPEINEKEMMCKVLKSLQGICNLPLSLDSSNPLVLEAAMRIYNGKPLVNSVNGDSKSMDAVFPLIKKYGGTVIALTLDKNGIPETAQGRVNIAERIIAKANEYEIDTKNIIFDPLAMTISSNPKNAQITLDTVELLSQKGYKTSLGISNVSFGLPNRTSINASFYTMALLRGLNCAIVNPSSREIMNAYHSYRALTGKDASCNDFIGFSLNNEIEKTTKTATEYTLKEAIIKGLSDVSVLKSKELLSTKAPLEIINDEIVPALEEIGKAFEEKRIFLPQLLMSAECSSKCFENLKEKMPQGASNGNSVIIATVKGDIHDIGKNIVKLLLESYGFNVHDLGKDVPPDVILEAVKEYNCKVVALSALMTTTLPAMEETVALLHKHDKSIKIMVGGAVLTEEYAKKINADAYGKDAMSAVRIVENFYNS